MIPVALLLIADDQLGTAKAAAGLPAVEAAVAVVLHGEQQLVAAAVGKLSSLAREKPAASSGGSGLLQHLDEDGASPEPRSAASTRFTPEG